MIKKSKHIVFGEFSKKTLINSKELNIAPENIISLNDDLRVGSIYKLNTEYGKTKRTDWLQFILKDTSIGNYIVDQVSEDISKIEFLKSNIESIQALYIWVGKNTLDTLATARLLYELQDLNINCLIADFSNIKLKSLRGNFFSPDSLVVVRPDQVHLLSKHFEPGVKKDHFSWSILWEKVIDTKEILRRLIDDGAIQNEEEFYFDNMLEANCTVAFKKAALVIGETLIDTNFNVPDWILNWRLKKLVAMKKIEAEGALKDIRDFNVKISAYNKS